VRHPTKNSTFLRTHNSTGSEQNKMSAAYSSCMNSLMSFLDNTEYADNTGDEIRKEGNPTKSQAVNDLIKKIERHEVRGTGIATAARRPIEWEEYIMLLIAARHVFSNREKAMYMILAVMSLQWHFIGRIDDILSLVTTTIQVNLRHPFCLQLKMRKSKNIRSERDMPTQIFFCINGSICVPCS